MTTEDINTKQEEERFEAILLQLKEGKDLPNEDALFLVELIRGLDHSYSITNAALSHIGETLTNFTQSLGLDVLSRAGRTDQKIKRSIVKLCDQYVNTLWTNARDEAARVALNLMQQQTTSTPAEEVAS